MKPVNQKYFDYAIYDKQPPLVEKHVKWLRSGDSTLVKVMKIALAALETLVLALSIIGIPLLCKGIQTAIELNKMETFFKQDFDSLKTGLPSSNAPIIIKSEKQTFNHACEYVIHNNLLWHRQKDNTDAEWAPIYLDTGRAKLEKISCDGSNLIVIDDKGLVHYKKILKEYRPKDYEAKAKKHLKNPSEEMGKKHLILDKSHLNNWKKSWFSVPYICHLVNFFTGRKLKIDQSARTIEIAHRGNYNDFTEDDTGQKHHVEAGVTTLYQLNSDGRTIRKFDPWAPKWSVAEIFMPETTKTHYEALNMSCSASTIMAVGYETDNTTNEQTLKIITRLADIDTEGCNPFLKYAFEKDENDPDVRVLPTEYKWKEHSLPEGGKITKEITIIQTEGGGNNARELRVEGENSEGIKGYFSKAITADSWNFTPLNTEKELAYLHAKKASTAFSLKDRVQDLTATINAKNGETVENVTIKNFGKRSTASKVKFVYKGQNYSLLLYRRLTLMSFVGLNDYRYDLVIPKKLRNNDAMKEIFGDNVSYHIQVKQNKNETIITPKKGAFSINAKG